VIANGQTPMITWEMGDRSLVPGSYWSLNDIIAGRHDDYFDRWATGIRDDAGGVVYVRIFHEMNLVDYPWSVHASNTLGNSPQQLAMAWRHIVDRFRASGTTNVRWVFNVGGDLANNALPTGTYPGDEYVDYIGADSYGNAPPNSLATDGTHIAEIAEKPWLMGEVAGPPEWVTNELLPFAQRRQVALVWFNKPPWPLTGHPELIAAVRPMLDTLSRGSAGSGPARITAGAVPRDGGFGLVVFGGGSLRDLVTAVGCPSVVTLWFASNGSFVIYVPGTSIGVVNAPFRALFPGDISPNTALIARCS
jgi:hypothetical protein